jgi:hypothetical protein
VALHRLFLELQPEFVHHGDCVGADVEAHVAAHWVGAKPIIHPPDNDAKRAHCTGWWEMREEKYYTDRNKDIVNESELLVACPYDVIHEKCRHGTCSTVRYARRLGKPVRVVLLDGTVE